MPFLIKQRKDRGRNIMRDGVGHGAPLKYVDGDGLTYFEHMPNGVDPDDPYYLVVDVDDRDHAVRYCKEAKRVLTEEIFVRPAPMIKGPPPPGKISKLADAIKGLSQIEQDELGDCIDPPRQDKLDAANARIAELEAELTAPSDTEDEPDETPFGDLHWTHAVKAAEHCEDLAQLDEWAKLENSPAVSKAIQRRIDELE